MSPLTFSLLAQIREIDFDSNAVWYIAIALVLVLAFGLGVIFFSYGKVWLQAYMSNARVSLMSLIGMSFRQVHTSVIVKGKIMAMQAGLGADPKSGITTRRLEAHYLAGGNVPNVISAIIAAHRADIRRRARRSPHERLPESDRLPRSRAVRAIVFECHRQRRR